MDTPPARRPDTATDSAAMSRSQSLRFVPAQHRRFPFASGGVSVSAQGFAMHRHHDRVTTRSRIVPASLERDRYGHPLRGPSGLHKAALPSVPGSHCAKASLCAGHRFAPYRVKATGFMQSGYAIPWLTWRCGIGQALRAVFQMVALRPVTTLSAPPAPGLRRYAATALALTARLPPRGALSRALCCFCA